MSEMSQRNLYLVNEWLEVKEAIERTSDNTIKAYKQDLLEFLSFLTFYAGSADGKNMLRL